MTGRSLVLVVLAACGSTPAAPPCSRASVAVVDHVAAPGDEMLAADHPMITVTGTVTTTSPGVRRARSRGSMAQPVDARRRRRVLDAAHARASASITSRSTASDGFGTTVEPAARRDVGSRRTCRRSPARRGFDIDRRARCSISARASSTRQLGTTLDLHDRSDRRARSRVGARADPVEHRSREPDRRRHPRRQSGSSSLDISIPSATPSEIIVDARVVDTPDTAIDLDIDLNGVFLATTGTFHVQRHATSSSRAACPRTCTRPRASRSPCRHRRHDRGHGHERHRGRRPARTRSFTGPDGDELDGFIVVGNNDFRTLVENFDPARS